jgi:hypothetical protein
LLAVPQLSLGAGFQSSAYTGTYGDQGLAHSSGLISIQLATITSFKCHPTTDRKPRNRIWNNFVFLPLCGSHATSNDNANRIFHSQTLHRFTAISVSQSHNNHSIWHCHGSNCSTYTWACDWLAVRSAGWTETTYEWTS